MKSVFITGILLSIFMFSNESSARVEVAFYGNSNVAAISYVNSVVESHVTSGGMLRAMNFSAMSSSAVYCIEIRDKEREAELVEKLRAGLSILWNPHVGDPRESTSLGTILARAEVVDGQCR